EGGEGGEKAGGTVRKKSLFRAPLALVKIQQEGKVTVKPVFCLAGLTLEISNIGLGRVPSVSPGASVSVQRFVRAPGPSPWYAVTTWERAGGAGGPAVKVGIVTSGLPYISNLAAHLDPAGIPGGHARWWEPGSEDGADVLESTVKMAVRGMGRGWGRGLRINKVGMDWVKDAETGDWMMANLRTVVGELTKHKGDSEGIPRWVYEGGGGRAAGAGVKRECCGDFCGREDGGKNVVWATGRQTVTGRSIVKARGERGGTVEARELGEGNMNRTFSVCGTCRDKYGEMDRERARRVREKLEEEERTEEEGRRRKGGVREKGWKSRLQVEYEKGLEEEKRKVAEMMDVRIRKEIEIERRGKERSRKERRSGRRARRAVEREEGLRALGIEVGSVRSGGLSSASSQGSFSSSSSSSDVDVGAGVGGVSGPGAAAGGGPGEGKVGEAGDGTGDQEPPLGHLKSSADAQATALSPIPDPSNAGLTSTCMLLVSSSFLPEPLS
ncbi:hypothetical protein TrRE_jg191, partial [Triparma retinervis]